MTAPGGGEDDIDITARLHDELSAPARTAAEEAEHLDRELKRLNRTLGRYNKRIDEAGAKTMKFAAALRLAAGNVHSFNEQMGHTNKSIDNYQKTLTKSTTQTDRHGQAINRAAKEHKSLQKVLGRTKSLLASLLPLLMKVGIGFALLGAAGGIVQLSQGVAAFVAAAINLVAIAGLIPSALAAVILSMVTLKIVLSGVGDVLKSMASGDVKAFDAALKKLSPTAQKALKDLRQFVPFFKDFKKSLQDDFFKPLVGMVGPAMRTLLPVIQQGLRGIATELGQVAKGMLNWASSTSAAMAFAAAFQAAKDLMHGFAIAAEPVLRGISAIIITMSDEWKSFTDEIGAAGVRFGDWLRKIADNGSLELMFRRAVDFAKQLWAVGKDIYDIFKSLGTVLAAGFDATGLMMFIHLIAEFAKSAAGMAIIGTILETVKNVATVLGPVFAQLAGILANSLIPALGSIVVALAPALASVLETIGFWLKPLLPMWPVLAQGLASLLVALTPLIPVLSELVQFLGRELGAVAEILAVILPPLLTALLLPLRVMLDAFNQWATIMMPILLPLLDQLAVSFQDMIGPMLSIAQIFSQQFAIYLPQFAAIVQQMLPVVVQFIQAGLKAWLQVMVALLPTLPQLISSVLGLMLAAMQLLPQLLPLVPVFMKLLGLVLQNVPALIMLAGALIMLIGVVLRVLTAILTFVNGAMNAFRTLVGFIKGGSWQSIGSALSQPFTSALGRIMGVINSISGGLSSLVNKAQSALGALASLNPFKFMGGPVAAGQPYTVGEIGPEMFIPNSGKPYMIGENGLEKSRTFGQAGTIIPSFMLKAMQDINARAQKQMAAAEAAQARQGDRVGSLAAQRGSQGAERTPEVTHNTFDFKGAHFHGEIDVQKAVKKALDEHDRQRRERK